MRLARRFALLLVASALAAGCGGGSGPEKAAAKEKPKAATKAKPAAETATATAVAYHYDPTGKPDPFRSFVTSLKKTDVASQSTPLERFDITQLKLDGIVWGTKPRALVRDPSGKAYIVAEGTAMGKNDGRVIRIDDNVVIVKETYVDFLGKATTKDIEMRLHERQGG